MRLVEVFRAAFSAWITQVLSDCPLCAAAPSARAFKPSGSRNVKREVFSSPSLLLGDSEARTEAPGEKGGASESEGVPGALATVGIGFPTRTGSPDCNSTVISAVPSSWLPS